MQAKSNSKRKSEDIVGPKYILFSGIICFKASTVKTKEEFINFQK